MAGHDRLTPEGKRFFGEIDNLRKLQVRIGFQHGEKSDPDSGADLADIAMWNEFGTTGEHPAPARPFLRQSVDTNADKISAMCKAQLAAIAKGKATAKGALQDIGVMQKGLIQHTIRGGDFEANADITINGGWMWVSKKDGTRGPIYIKGKGSNRPLVNTGRMKQSINFVIVPKGE